MLAWKLSGIVILCLYMNNVICTSIVTQAVRFERKPFHTVQAPVSDISDAEKDRDAQQIYPVANDDDSWTRYIMPQELTEDLVESEAKPCDKSCPYGLENDIEGRQLCKCKEPCRGVKCFGGQKCIPQRECTFDECTYTAVCKAEDICSLPKPKHTFMCDKLSKRFYFDRKKGRCRKFWGCEEITGNSFSSKRDCTKACETNKVPEAKKKDGRVEYEKLVQEMSNHIPSLDNIRHHSRFEVQDAGEIMSNHIESQIQTSHQSQLKSELSGLNHLAGCPEDSPYIKCPFDPCAGCSNPEILCLASFCGNCQAIYIDLRSGQASNQFAAIC